MPFLDDGFQTLVSFSLAPGALFREKDVEPVGLDIGSIDTTTMRNLTVRTFIPKSLATLDEMVLMVQWDPRLYTQILTTLLGAIGDVTITFPDASAIIFLGFVTKFKPQKMQEGEFPLAELRVTASNQTALGIESLPITP